MLVNDVLDPHEAGERSPGIGCHRKVDHTVLPGRHGIDGKKRPPGDPLIRAAARE
ncbi:MAG: hypothetical protein M3Y41_04715 [Pseudomonadota bacterium]|nr:hypothetical protein [Pseudomonadota bacterium]